MIQFKYTLSDDIGTLIQGTMASTYTGYLVGYLPDELAHDLHHCSLYMVCELDYNKKDNINIYSNPVAVVARNEGDALSTFYAATNKGNGMVYGKLHDRCDKIKVEAL